MKDVERNFIFVAVMSAFEDCRLHSYFPGRSRHRGAEYRITRFIFFCQKLSNRSIELDIFHIQTGRLQRKTASELVLMQVT
jgi:hypothetical protein